MAILANHTVLGAHYIAQTLGIWAGMAFITIVGFLAMLLMNGFG